MKAKDTSPVALRRPFPAPAFLKTTPLAHESYAMYLSIMIDAEIDTSETGPEKNRKFHRGMAEAYTLALDNFHRYYPNA